MKKIFFIAFLLPFYLIGQNCKSYAVLNGHSGTSEITKKELAEIKKLEVGGNCGEYRVISYEFTMKIKGQPVSFTGTGSTFSKDVGTVLTQPKAGSKIFFDNIKAKGPDGKVKIVPGITLIVKE